MRTLVPLFEHCGPCLDLEHSEYCEHSLAPRWALDEAVFDPMFSHTRPLPGFDVNVGVEAERPVDTPGRQIQGVGAATLMHVISRDSFIRCREINAFNLARLIPLISRDYVVPP